MKIDNVNSSRKLSAIVFVFAGLALLISVKTFSLSIQETEDGKGSPMPKQLILRTIKALQNQPSPIISSIQFFSAKDGKPGRVEVTLPPAMVRGKVGVSATAVHYSTNSGRDWKRVEVKREAMPGLMSAAIPAFGGRREYMSFRAESEKGGTLVEASCMVNKWPPDDAVLKKTCQNMTGEKLENCVRAGAPAGCMFPISPEDAPVDDMPSRAGDDLDLLGAYAGYNGNSLFLLLNIQRDISSGSMTPMNFNEYGFVIMNPLFIGTASDETLPYGGIFVRYIPMGVASPDFVAPCAAVFVDNDEMKVDKTSVECKVRKSALLVKLDRKKLGLANAKELLLSAHSGVISGTRLDSFSIVNMTPPARVILGNIPAKKSPKEGKETGKKNVGSGPGRGKVF